MKQQYKSTEAGGIILSRCHQSRLYEGNGRGVGHHVCMQALPAAIARVTKKMSRVCPTLNLTAWAADHIISDAAIKTPQNFLLSFTKTVQCKSRWSTARQSVLTPPVYLAQMLPPYHRVSRE